MKKLCCAVVLVWVILGCFYLPKIVNSDADLLDSGRICAINEDASTIKILDNRYTFYEYEVPLRDAFLNEELCIGNKVYIYSDGPYGYASTVLVDDAKAVNLFLYNYFIKKAINPWFIFAVFLVSSIIMYWMIFDRKNKYRYIFISLLVIVLFPLFLEPNFKLFYVGGGEVVTVYDDNKIVTDKGEEYHLLKNEDIVSGDEINKGDVVYLYRYGLRNNAYYTETVASTKMLDKRTLEINQIYPNIYMISMSILGIIFICWGCFWQAVRKLKEEEEY